MSKFIDFLEENTRLIRKWPAWKRNMLGPVFSEAEEKEIEQEKNQNEVMIVFPTAPTGAEILKSCWNQIQWIGDSYLPKAIDDAMASYAGALKLEIIDLNMRIAELKKEKYAPKPVKYRDKEYWPDFNGWYDMECIPEEYKDGRTVLISDGRSAITSYYDDNEQCWCYHLYPDAVNVYRLHYPQGWQILPYGWRGDK
jgi:hypothetical protein